MENVGATDPQGPVFPPGGGRKQVAAGRRQRRNRREIRNGAKIVCPSSTFQACRFRELTRASLCENPASLARQRVPPATIFIVVLAGTIRCSNGFRGTKNSEIYRKKEILQEGGRERTRPPRVGALCLDYLHTDLTRYELFYGIVKWLAIKSSLDKLSRLAVIYQGGRPNVNKWRM